MIDPTTNHILHRLIRPQTDITEIDKGLTPLWFDGVDPAKISELPGFLKLNTS
jgi:hypothetical protein